MKALAVIEHRIAERNELNFILSRWKLKGEKIVFTNGCFDILHQGHVDYLSKAADLGTKLAVGVNSDDSVRRLGKDRKRPIQDENSRALIVAALHFVDLVVLFGEDTPLKLIEELNPQVLVKGSDYKINEIVGHDFVTNSGGEVRTIDFLEGFSTSKIVEKARE